MSYNSRRPLMPVTSKKRKEREAFYNATSSRPLAPLTAVNPVVSRGNPTTSSNGAEQQPMCSNRLLAGYMAYEFLTKGTLLGERFDPARAEAVPVNSADSKRNRHVLSQSQQNVETEPSGKSKPQSYAEVASLLKGDVAHIPGILNPTQLARWIQM
ncbi:hypothetical protein Fot_52800 [Forsythia ovata]